MSLDSAPDDVSGQMRRDREMRVLVGCERCGRKICHIEDLGGELTTHTVSSAALIPADDWIDDSDRMFVCEYCHGQWLMDRLFRSGEE